MPCSLESWPQWPSTWQPYMSPPPICWAVTLQPSSHCPSSLSCDWRTSSVPSRAASASLWPPNCSPWRSWPFEEPPAIGARLTALSWCYSALTAMAHGAMPGRRRGSDREEAEGSACNRGGHAALALVRPALTPLAAGTCMDPSFKNRPSRCLSLIPPPAPTHPPLILTIPRKVAKLPVATEKTITAPLRITNRFISPPPQERATL